MATSKINSLLGFCIKSGNLALGAGAIDAIKKGVYLIIVCSSGTENCFKLALKYKNRFSCPLMICKCGLGSVVHKENCKLAAVKDEGFARAICENVGEEYELYTGRQ